MKKNNARWKLIRLGMPFAMAAAALTVTPETIAFALDGEGGQSNPSEFSNNDTPTPGGGSGQSTGGGNGNGGTGGGTGNGSVGGSDQGNGSLNGGGDGPVGGNGQGVLGNTGNGNGSGGGSDKGTGSLNGGGDGVVGGSGQGVLGATGNDNGQDNGGTLGNTLTNGGGTGGEGQGETPTNDGGTGTNGNTQGGTGQDQTLDGNTQGGTGQGQTLDNQGEGGDGNGQNATGQDVLGTENEGETLQNGNGTDGDGLETPGQNENPESTDGEGQENTGAPMMRSMRLFSAPSENDQQVMLMRTVQNNDQDNNGQDQQWTVSYVYNAELHEADGDKQYAGVYVATIDENEDEKFTETIGMPSIADENLKDEPTTESPAIITGAAVGYETRDMGKPVEESFTPKDAQRDAPYSYFNHGFMTEQGQDGTTHTKLTGFDGTYVITRIDLSHYLMSVAGGFGQETDGKQSDKQTLQDLFVGQFLHVKQEGNNALMAALGIEKKDLTTGETTTTLLKTFSDALGNKTGAYNVAALFDEAGVDADKPFFDVVVFATAANVAGADAGKENVNNGDIKLSFYVDGVDDYNPTLNYNPQSTEPTHLQDCLNKFFNYDEAKKKDASLYSALSTYTLKGSHLALETVVDEGNGKTTYWSLKKAIEKPYYDQKIDKSATDKGTGRTVKLMSEVAIVNGLNLTGQPGALKKRTLDVNSFDIQIAKNTAKDKTDHSDEITMQDAWLKIADNSNTTGAELAIGNNAQMNVKKGGKLIIDKTCQLEIEWDGATQTPKEGDPQTTPDTLNNGLLNIEAGGEVENNGIISIEGTEGKPYSETNKDQVVNSDKGFGELTIKEGAKLTNNGSLMVYGVLYNLGTIVNNGSYDQTIDSFDPDQGTFSYHKGITATWKDDITQQNITYGKIVNGKDRDGNTSATATLINNGDIVLNPGELDNYATLVMNPGSNIFTCTATEAIIPVEPPKTTDPQSTTPPPQTKRIFAPADFPAKPSKIVNDGTIVMDDGRMATASIELKDNGSFGTMTLTNEEVPMEGTGIVVYVEHPAPVPIPDPWFDPDRGRRDWDTDSGSSDWVYPDVPAQDQKHRSTIDVIIDGSPVKWAIDADDAGEATMVEIDDGVYQITAMPTVTLDTIVASISVTDPDKAGKIVELVEAGEANVWWCAEVNGQAVHIMDIYGNLAPNVASVRYVVAPDGQTNIIVEFVDGTILVLEGFDDLFLELDALAWS